MPIGTIAAWVVGMPGPDIDYCIISGYSDVGYKIRFQVWGQGEWYEADVPLKSAWASEIPDSWIKPDRYHQIHDEAARIAQLARLRAI